LTASVQDVRDLVAYRLGLRPRDEGEPLLARGWRAEVVGQLVDDLLAGRLGIRITDPLSDAPMSFEPFG
jgi:ribonuclease D